jgi:sec-independent protein translocase protein TatC
MALVPFPSPQSGALPLPPDDDDDSPVEGKMSFLEHLDELRKRIVHSAIAIAVCVVVGFYWINQIVNFILAPTRKALPEGVKLIYTQPGEAFSLYVQIALIMGVVLAAPYIMYQVWRFIAPGLYANEKKFAIPFVLFSTIFFLIGALFSHYVAFPWTWKFFISFETPYMKFMPKISEAFSLYVTMLLGFGLIFQMPTIVMFLARMGVVTAGFLFRHTKYAVLIIFIVAAVISPGTDVVSQCLMAGPMLGLYGISILVAWIFGKSRTDALD